MAIAQVQKKASGAVTGTSLSLSYDATPTQGNLLVVFAFAHTSTDDIVMVSSGWTAAANAGQAAVAPKEIGYYKLAGASEPVAVEISATSPLSLGLALFEYSGVSTFDKSAVLRTANVTTITSPLTDTTTAAEELALAGIGMAGTSGGGWGTWSSSFTAEHTDINSRFSTASRVLSATGQHQTGNSWTTVRTPTIVLMTFKSTTTPQKARPVSDTAAGAWTASSGSDLFAMVDEATASDTDYITGVGV